MTMKTNRFFSSGLTISFSRLSLRAAAILLTLCSLTSCGSKSHPPTRSEINAIDNAAESGNLQRVKALIKSNPALVSSTNKLGDTPLHWAVGKGHADVAELLLAYHADVNRKGVYGYTPLHWTAQLGYADEAKLLLSHGADVNARNTNLDTPLHKAAGYGFKDVAELLVSHGADVNAKNYEGRTPLRLAEEHGAKDIADLLRQHGGHE
jgi:ankyrin repeat protein